jgi:hypothetical protein
VDGFIYKFENFFHPFVADLIKRLNQAPPGAEIGNMLDPKFLEKLREPASGSTAQLNYFEKIIDLDCGPYANYNWELLYHIPLMIAVHLSNNQRFAEAQKWFHYVFDPTSTDTSIAVPQRWWKFLGFRDGCEIQSIEKLLTLLSTPDNQLTGTQPQTKKAVLDGYNAILQSPFQPHVIAQTTRITAYQWYVVMKYLDNLIAWGDNLFLQNTIETINEATLCYVLAASLLGPRPQVLPPRGIVKPRNFLQMKEAKLDPKLDPMGNAMVEL